MMIMRGKEMNVRREKLRYFVSLLCSSYLSVCLFLVDEADAGDLRASALWQLIPLPGMDLKSLI